MRGVPSTFCALALLFLGGCACDERVETADSVDRYLTVANEDYEHTLAAIRRWAPNNLALAHNLRGDVQRFLVSRKLQWWALEDQLAYHITANWEAIHQLTDGVVRGYGYHIDNWPVMVDDVLRFLARGDEEWVNLVQDVAIFLEYQNRAFAPLSDQLRYHYELWEWEYVNLGVDVQSFLEWRDREYAKLLDDGRRWFHTNTRDMVEDFKADVRRFVVDARGAELAGLHVDIRWYLDHEAEQWPQLRDDFARYWRNHLHGLRLGADVRRSMQMARRESQRLGEAVERFHRHKVAEMERVLAGFQRWSQTYEREIRPLTEGIKRFWRYHLAQGDVTLEAIRRFYAHSEEEIAWLKQDLSRFVHYGYEEYEGLQGNLQRFFTCLRDSTYGDSTMPFAGDTYGHAPLYGPIRRDDTFDNGY